MNGMVENMSSNHLVGIAAISGREIHFFLQATDETMSQFVRNGAVPDNHPPPRDDWSQLL